MIERLRAWWQTEPTWKRWERAYHLANDQLERAQRASCLRRKVCGRPVRAVGGRHVQADWARCSEDRGVGTTPS